MKLYSHLQLKDAKRIIILKKQGFSNYKIVKSTGFSKGVVSRCLDAAYAGETRIVKQNSRFRNIKFVEKYSFELYMENRFFSKEHRAFECAQHSQEIYLPFLKFCKNLYETKVLGKKVKRSANEYIKEFRKAFPEGDYPKKSWIYRMASSEYYDFDPKWLINTEVKYSNKKIQVKPMKFNSIEKRENIAILSSTDGNYEIDSVIGKLTDKTALLSLINIKTGEWFGKKYNRSAQGFANAFKEIISEAEIQISTLTCDNGSENNLLGTIVNPKNIYNCHAYCSWEKGRVEKKHVIVRQVIPKGISLDIYSNDDIDVLVKFVNNYYSKQYNRI